MNRLVIIGNGFDLAHGLPTSYEHFLIHLQESIVTVQKTGSNTGKIVIKNGRKSNSQKNYYHRVKDDGKIDTLIGVIHEEGSANIQLSVPLNSESIYIKSLFHSIYHLGFWSDLETHYFDTLYNNRNDLKKIKWINYEFNHLKNLLEEYLSNEVENKTDEGEDYDLDTSNPIFKMLDDTHRNFKFSRTYFVTFNYTSKIIDYYNRSLNAYHRDTHFFAPPIHIHGKLNSKENPIIFGYGDENSSKYEDLEELLNNDLLENFKTFQYLKQDNYNRVLGLLNDRVRTYVQIIGHSCGLTDKALLRSIFQHEKVRAIEATYHLNQTKYFDNLYNISRIFDDNTLMRKKLIPLPKTYKIE